MSGWQEAARRMSEAVAEPSSTPGGGAVAAHVGAMGAALGRMAAAISAKGHERRGDAGRLEGAKRVGSELAGLQEKLLDGMEADAKAFDGVMAALKLSKDDDGRWERLEAALKRACEVPLETARAALEVLDRLQELDRFALASIASDVKVGRTMARAAIGGALENVEINLVSITDAAYVKTARRDAAGLAAAGRE